MEITPCLSALDIRDKIMTHTECEPPAPLSAAGQEAYGDGWNVAANGAPKAATSELPDGRRARGFRLCAFAEEPPRRVSSAMSVCAELANQLRRETQHLIVGQFAYAHGTDV